MVERTAQFHRRNTGYALLILRSTNCICGIIELWRKEGGAASSRDVVYSSEIEGVGLNVDAMRSSIARRLGIESVRFTAPSHYIDGVVAVMLDAMEHYDMILTKEKLCAWHSAFFPTGISSAINKDKRHYYKILELTTNGDGDITQWLLWYLSNLLTAIREAETLLDSVLRKSMFWMHASGIPLNERQTNVLNMFLDGYDAKITSKSWAKLGKCSKDTAILDIHDLASKELLEETVPGAKRPSYKICISNLQ